MNPVDTIRFEGGLTAAIHHDSDAAQPFRDDDAVRIVILHRRYIDPSDGTCGSTPEDLAAWQAENAAEWFSIPLFLFDHSGTIYRVGRSNPFHCPWDSGRVGIIALKRSEWGSGNESDAKLSEFAQSVADEYTAWANGECYGYVLSDGAGREVGSCWGFIGIDHVREQATAAAQDCVATCEDGCNTMAAAVGENADAITRPPWEAAPVTVWLVQIGHKHGDDYAVFSTREAAKAHLHAYVTDWWDEGLSEQYGELNALTCDEAIEAYFDAHHNAFDFEFYTLEELILDAKRT